MPLLFVGARHRSYQTRDVPKGLGASSTSHGQPLSDQGAWVLSRPALLVIQTLSSVVTAAFLAYHPLELAGRMAAGTEFPVRGSVWVVMVALLGLLVTVGVLLWRPQLLIRARRVVVVAGGTLGLSLVIRAVGESFGLVVFAAVLSGAAVGLNSSALFASALEVARGKHAGRLMGAYSAAGALGQFIGPVVALVVLAAIGRWSILPLWDDGGYRQMFLVLAAVPIAWMVALLLWPTRSTSKPSPRSFRSVADHRVTLPEGPPCGVTSPNPPRAGRQQG